MANELTKCIPIDGDLIRIGFTYDDSDTTTTIHWSRYQEETEETLAELPKGARRDEETRLRVWLIKEVKKALAKLPAPEEE